MHVFTSLNHCNNATQEDTETQNHDEAVERTIEMRCNITSCRSFGDLECPNTPSADLEQQCGICLDYFQVDDIVSWSKYLYSCRHVYHQRCIDTWLNENRHDDCPSCRGTFIRENPDEPRIIRIHCCLHGKKEKDGAQCPDDDMMMQQREMGQFCLTHGLILLPTCDV